MKLKIINVVGARPNFMKIAPIIKVFDRYSDKIDQLLVHTGQHYDDKMSKFFFNDLGLPKPDIDLEVGSGSHAEQTAGVMVAFEKVLLKEQPHLVLVVGDVNSTMACTITAKKLGIKVAHVEAGLRSRDMTMPEEINRLCTDVLADYLFTTDYIANKNLEREGAAVDKIFFVGNVMIDTLLAHKKRAARLDTCKRFGLTENRYIIMTLHRPSNVDDKDILRDILNTLKTISADIPILFPCHPRTLKMINSFGLQDIFNKRPGISKDAASGFLITEPLGYLDFLNLTMNSRLVLTDSGGLQEETTVLGVPCITLRPNTERPITEELGTNQVIGNNPGKILAAIKKTIENDSNTGKIPPKWDGKAGRRIVDVLLTQKNR